MCSAGTSTHRVEAGFLGLFGHFADNAAPPASRSAPPALAASGGRDRLTLARPLVPPTRRRCAACDPALRPPRHPLGVSASWSNSVPASSEGVVVWAKAAPGGFHLLPSPEAAAAWCALALPGHAASASYSIALVVRDGVAAVLMRFGFPKMPVSSKLTEVATNPQFHGGNRRGPF